MNGQSSIPRRRRHASRRGAMTVFCCVLIVLIVVFAAWSINICWMELTMLEMRASVDAAAKAAIVNYCQTQNQTTARNFARTLATSNTVSGRTVTLADSNIVFGNATMNSSNRFTFTANATPFNSAQVRGTMVTPLIFPAMLTTSSFTPDVTSIATRIDHDIVLVLDRSGSMAFDLTQQEFSYPSDRSTGSVFQNYFQTPSPTGSRWKALSDAVATFVSTVQSRQLNARVGLVTYAEAFTFGQYSATQYTVDQAMTTNYSLINTAIAGYMSKELLGDTNIQVGYAQGYALLTGAGSRATAQKTIVLLTDGVPTAGSQSLGSIAAGYRTNKSVITHVITFGGQANSGTYNTMMQDMATQGNGQFWAAPTSTTLTNAFRSIAETLPAVLIQ